MVSHKGIRSFFRKKMGWIKVPHRITSGIKRLARGSKSRWHIGTSKKGNKTLWSIARNIRSQSGRPRIKRLLTRSGMRYLVEGEKGFVPGETAKYLMGMGHNKSKRIKKSMEKRLKEGIKLFSDE